MSLSRELKRRKLREDLRLNGMRRTCRKCGAKMATKPGYGWLCVECGWEPSMQVKIREELDGGKVKSDEKSV